MSPDEIKQYIRDMKERADKLLKKKEKEKKRGVAPSPSLPEPKEPWPASLGDSSCHYYCLVCTVYTGKLARWLEHRLLEGHREAYTALKAQGLERHGCQDIDLQVLLHSKTGGLYL